MNATEDPNARVDLQNLEAVDYATVQAAVIGPKCVGCHGNASGNQGGVNLETYTALRASLNRVAHRSLVRQDMPPRDRLSDRQGQILTAWIEAGAPEVVAASTSPRDPSLEQGPTDFAKIRDKIWKTKCLDCHAPPAPQGDLDLTSLIAVRAKAAAIFERVYLKQDMPVAPYPMLTPRERKVLLQWFDSGMPQ